MCYMYTAVAVALFYFILNDYSYKLSAVILTAMFQHTERHIKRRSTYCSELEAVTSALN